MHPFDLEYVFALAEKVMVKLIPASGCCDFGTGETGDGRHGEAIDGQAESVSEQDSEQNPYFLGKGGFWSSAPSFHHF